MILEFKNISASTLNISGLVQVDKDTPNVNDGTILAGQTLDFMKSFMLCEIGMHMDIANAIQAGHLVFIVDGAPISTSDSKSLWDLSAAMWKAVTSQSDFSYLENSPLIQKTIRNALQNLSGEERLDVSAIKNLP